MAEFFIFLNKHKEKRLKRDAKEINPQILSLLEHH